MITQTTTGTFSSPFLETKAIETDRFKALGAFRMLVKIEPGLRDGETVPLSSVIKDLTQFIQKQASIYRHEACSILNKSLNTTYPLPSDFDYFDRLGELIATLDNATVAKDQKKLLLVISNLLTHILLRDKDEEANFVPKDKTAAMKKVFEQLKEIKKRKDNKFKSDDAYLMNYLLSYSTEAFKYIMTEQTYLEKNLSGVLKVIAGVACLADKKIYDGLNLIKDGIKLIEIKKEWFPVALAIRGLEFKSVQANLEVTKELIAQIRATPKEKEEVRYQGFLSLSNVALFGEILEIRTLAANAANLLKPLKDGESPHLAYAYVRHLAKIEAKGKTAEERSIARGIILSLELKSPFIQRKQDDLKAKLQVGSTRQIEAANKAAKFSGFGQLEGASGKNSSTSAKPVVSNERQGSPERNISNTSPQGSPPPPGVVGLLSSVAKSPVKYREAKLPEACLARVLGSSWDDFYKDWLRFEMECQLEGSACDVDLGQLQIRGANASSLRLSKGSFYLIAKFLNGDAGKTYNEFDLTLAEYKADELANFLPQIEKERRDQIELVLAGEKEYVDLAKALFLKNSFGISSKILEKAMAKNPKFGESCDFLAQLGKAYNKLKHKDTEAIYKKSLGIDPNHTNTLYQYSFFLDENKRQEEGFAVLRKFIAIKPESPNGHYTLALNLSNFWEDNMSKKFLLEEAKKEIGLAFKIDPEDEDIKRVKTKIENNLVKYC